MLDWLAQWLDGSTTLSLVFTLVVAAAFFLLGVWFRPRRRPRLVFTTSRIQSRNHPDITIRFKGREVENLYSIRFAFWNAGRREIRHEDLPAADAPHLQLVERCEIMSVSSVASDASTNATARHSGLRVDFSFDFLNPGQGLFAEVLCATSEGHRLGFSVGGTIIGASRTKIRRYFEWSPLSGIPVYVLGIMTLIAGSLTAFVAFTRGSTPDAWLGGTLTIVSGAMALGFNERFRTAFVPGWVRLRFADGAPSNATTRWESLLAYQATPGDEDPS